MAKAFVCSFSSSFGSCLDSTCTVFQTRLINCSHWRFVSAHRNSHNFTWSGFHTFPSHTIRLSDGKKMHNAMHSRHKTNWNESIFACIHYLATKQWYNAHNQFHFDYLWNTIWAHKKLLSSTTEFQMSGFEVDGSEGSLPSYMHIWCGPCKCWE